MLRREYECLVWKEKRENVPNTSTLVLWSNLFPLKLLAAIKGKNFDRSIKVLQADTKILLSHTPEIPPLRKTTRTKSRNFAWQRLYTFNISDRQCGLNVEDAHSAGHVTNVIKADG